MRWTYTPLPAAEIEAICSRTGVSPVLAELLLRNGHREADATAKFLAPALSGLNDPFLLRSLTEAATRLRGAIERREAVAVLGDYDVDGVSSTALLVGILRAFGLTPHFVVPRRQGTTSLEEEKITMIRDCEFDVHGFNQSTLHESSVPQLPRTDAEPTTEHCVIPQPITYHDLRLRTGLSRKVRPGLIVSIHAF